MRVGLAAAASFTDVPDTHPYFAYVEAMKAKGITAGCSLDPPKFCPEDYATRGQVAAFLMRAIGSPVNSTTAPEPVSPANEMMLFGQRVTPLMAAGGALIVAALILRR